MSKFNSSERIGEIVAKFPKAADIFIENKIDFCCGGDRSLIVAIEEKGLNETKILDDLNKLYEEFANNLDSKDINWQEAPIIELVEYIINKHHAYLWDELPRISKLTTTILKVHGQSHPELSKVHKLFNTLKMELEEHLNKEETMQYPAVREYARTKSYADLERAINIINELEKEHTGAGDILKELRIVTDDYKIPDDVCPTFELTYEKLQEMESDLFKHIHLENNILFPRLRQLFGNKA
ncbi:iron-sulfur cluster repair di-iron protein [Tissierella carlieri]|uniref:iron-sulfur cluster repair di-iron protein n=1 Tax=Tissierella carlieri TaxID=689904 RepID=UPI001C0FE818|nr:iron-sulfur cluster repair di-iron protein [Tissierella carlieri]MBU5312696.1 iron-sulfur cluster repair di-iron protein [Tissierella carlieri]MDU5081937.1 iron-sulfur cluster repair di-iron protein [Bacillota bacterium]